MTQNTSPLTWRPYKGLTVLMAVALAMAACSPAASATTAPNVVKSVPAALVSACKTEGMLTIIATPASWANYGEIFKLFEATSGVKINSLNENAGFSFQYNDIRNPDKTGANSPDLSMVARR